jgi:hypothetical protein
MVHEMHIGELVEAIYVRSVSCDASASRGSLSNMKRLLASLGSILLGFAGCHSGGDGGESARSARDSLCPSCTPMAGGQTGDFGGSTPCLFEHPIRPPNAEEAEQFHVADVQSLRGDFAVSIGWRLAEDAPAEVKKPKERRSMLRGTFVLEDELLLHDYLATTHPNAATCGKVFEIPLTIRFATDDGAIAGEAQGMLQRTAAHDRWWGYASVDIGDATGSLDLRLYPPDPNAGKVVEIQGSLDFRFDYTSEHGLRGSVTPVVSYWVESRDSTSVDDRQREFLTSTTIEAVFPDPCVDVPPSFWCY